MFFVLLLAPEVEHLQPAFVKTSVAGAEAKVGGRLHFPYTRCRTGQRERGGSCISLRTGGGGARLFGVKVEGVLRFVVCCVLAARGRKRSKRGRHANHARPLAAQWRGWNEVSADETGAPAVERRACLHLFRAQRMCNYGFILSLTLLSCPRRRAVAMLVGFAGPLRRSLSSNLSSLTPSTSMLGVPPRARVTNHAPWRNHDHGAKCRAHIERRASTVSPPDCQI